MQNPQLSLWGKDTATHPQIRRGKTTWVKPRKFCVWERTRIPLLREDEQLYLCAWMNRKLTVLRHSCTFGCLFIHAHKNFCYSHRSGILVHAHAQDFPGFTHAVFPLQIYGLCGYIHSPQVDLWDLGCCYSHSKLWAVWSLSPMIFR